VGASLDDAGCRNQRKVGRRLPGGGRPASRMPVRELASVPVPLSTDAHNSP